MFSLSLSLATWKVGGLDQRVLKTPSSTELEMHTEHQLDCCQSVNQYGAEKNQGRAALMRAAWGGGVGAGLM